MTDRAPSTAWERERGEEEDLHTLSIHLREGENVNIHIRVFMNDTHTHTKITRTEFDKCVREFLAVDSDATQQVDELVVGQEVIQQHSIVHLVFTLKHTQDFCNQSKHSDHLIIKIIMSRAV